MERFNSRVGGALVLAMLLVAAVGCGSNDWVTVRSTPYSPLVERFKLTSRKGPQSTVRTQQVLRRYGLEEVAKRDPRRALEKLRVEIDQEPTPEKLYTFAEVAFLEGKKRELTDPQTAMDLFESSVAYSYRYLFDPRGNVQLNPYDPQFRGACDLYNGALESALRIACEDGKLVPGTSHTVRSSSGAIEISVVAHNSRWNREDFAEVEFVSDYDIRGLTNHYHTYGLGVPLIAVRNRREGAGPSEQFYPEGLSFPVTAFLRLLPPEGPPGSHKQRALLELYDPLEATDTLVGNVRIPLESDLTTPLAFFLNRGPNPSLIATVGLLRPDKSKQLSGLYMTQPYDPNKIPVLFVHGLWSSPTTWTDMFNDLRAAREVRENYQFWFYLYPTGQPFWVSAAQMREDLAAVRDVLDPHGQQPALDQMVLVGHSMGGLVSKMQTVSGGDQYWGAVSEQPFHLVKASPQTKQLLQTTFYFQPNPSIRRFVTIGTPHHGSEFANKYTRYLGQKLIALPQTVMSSVQELSQLNPMMAGGDKPYKVPTSIDSLAPDSPVLPVLLRSQRLPGVKHHNIAGVMGLDSKSVALEDGSDGVVSYRSAHVEDAVSELVVDANHLSVHRHPLAVLEVRRILLEHLDEAHYHWQRQHGIHTASGVSEIPQAVQPQPIQPQPVPYGPPLPMGPPGVLR